MHCQTGLPYSQFLRVRRICSDITDFDRNTQTLSHHFKRRGYPETLITSALEKARSKDRQTLLSAPSHTTTSDKTDNLFAITTYQPNFAGIKPAILKNWHQLTRSNDTKYIFDTKIIFGHRRSKNLCEMLVHEKVNYPPKPTNMDTPSPVVHQSPCTTKKCRYCPRLNTTGRITCSVTNREYSSKIRVDCKSSNLIYCITCKICKIQYIGQTKRRLMDRFQGHFYNINSRNQKDVVGHHFNQPGHNGISDIEIHIVDFIHAHPESTKAIRRTIERNWQYRMHSNAPQGLNKQD